MKKNCTCLDCPQQFQFKKDWRDHIHRELMDKDFECVVCRQTFPIKQEFEDHISEHHDGFKSKVPICKYFKQGRCTRQQCAFRHPQSYQQRQQENQWAQQDHQRHYLNQQQQKPLNQPQQQPQHGWLANCRRGPVHS